MVDNLIHEVTVVTHYDNTASKVAQILLKHLEGENVEIVGRLVKNEEVGIAHEHGTQVETATFASAQLIHIAMLLLRWEKEMLKELRGGELLASSHRDNLGYFASHVNHLHLLVKQQSLLRVIAEAYSLANIETSAIRCYLPHEEFEERTLSRTIVAHDTQFLVTREDI